MKSDDRTNSRERALVALVAAAFALVAGLLILPRADANPASVAAQMENARARLADQESRLAKGGG